MPPSSEKRKPKKSILKITVRPQKSAATPVRPVHSAGASHESQPPAVAKQAKPRQKLSKRHIFNAMHRLVVIASAFQYILISITATWRTVQVFRAMPNPTEAFEVYRASFIATYMGDALIYDSPLVQDVLSGDTSPRDYAVFLESETKTSTEGCAEVPLFNPDIYNYAFLSQGYQKLVNDTAHSSTMLSELELVTVVVDCSFTQLKLGDTSAVRIFNLLRSEKEHTVLYMATVSLSLQDYEIRAHKKSGPALLGMLTVVNDMREETVEGFYAVAPTYLSQRNLDLQVYELVGITGDSYMELRSIPRDPLTEPVVYLITARQRGFYDGDDQSNVRYMYFLLESDAMRSLTHWEWLGEPVIADSWAWVHGIHTIFAVQTVFSLVVLFLVMYQNFLAGKIWIGDHFASFSTTTVIIRGAIVVVTWYVNSFWTLFEFAMSNAAILSGTEIVRVHEELVHADVLVVYLSVVAMISSVIRERIPPSIAIFLFEIIHKNRLVFIRICPPVLREIVNYSNKVFSLEGSVVTSVNAVGSSLHFSTAFPIPKRDDLFLAASFFPKISMLGMIVVYALTRKVYWYFYPDNTHHKSTKSAGGQASNANDTLVLKGDLTNFEVSTGAELQTRFGIISDYRNYVYFKGMKFASADGVYCSGYVIVNGRYLMRSEDLPSVAMMKFLNTRFTNVDVYEVDGSNVKDTARLVYPDTFFWDDLWRLNVTVLL
ncbi:hypothetical protein PF005_g15803 [Phytophthora fragariae]|uniref:Transmembrane protein n=3 Tax=Phytophthora fragariae TaxID=53985 RepID=A0A6A3RKJ3_9STRA|nr:hypothetical protein PF003_g24850 [Phytophthora fragariae]KAE9098708.1 hypothetical protein PF007_g16168 [Phytophthora fragariae]KAE9134144.1 hypothetical protein PF006_g14891 [Phytophthora fragariae]KAE9199301.1 hypothetical protein PF005_g15803 [Phytophthora fragariae]